MNDFPFKRISSPITNLKSSPFYLFIYYLNKTVTAVCAVVHELYTTHP